MDITLYHRGFHGDLNETFLVGDKVDADSIALVQGAYACMMAGIGIGEVDRIIKALNKTSLAVKPGVKYREIGVAIEKEAKKRKLSVVRTYCGHGIHRLFHTSPNVPHYASKYM